MSADDQNSHKMSIWDDSPYMRFLREEKKDQEAKSQEEEEEEESDQHGLILVDAKKQMHDEVLPDVICSEPPPGYFDEFNVETTTAPENNVNSQFMEDESFAKDTTLGQAMDIVLMDSANGIHDEDVQKHSKVGAKFLDSVTKVPLSDFWHILTRVVAGVIFITNVISSLYDLIREPENLHYKVPNFIFGIVATVCISIGFYILHKVKESEEGNEKNMEGENEDEEVNTEEELIDDDTGEKRGEEKSEDEKEEKHESEDDKEAKHESEDDKEAKHELDETEVTAESEEGKEDGNKEDEETDKKDNKGDEDVTDEDTEGGDEDMVESEEMKEEDDVEETNENKDMDNEGENEEKEGDIHKGKEENMKDEQKTEDNNVGKKNEQKTKKKKRRKKKHKKEKEDEGPTEERNDNNEETAKADESEEKETEKAEANEDEKQENVDENEERKSEKDEENDEKEKDRLTENDKKKKYQQYIENIAHEAILYPIIVLNVFGFATDVVEGGWFGKVQLALIIIDALDITWTQIMRIYMIRRFLTDIAVKLGGDADVGMKILRRGIFTTISNFIFFIFLIILLGVQVHSDNYCVTHDANSSINYDKWCGNASNHSQLKYRGSVNSAFLLIAVVVIPLFNLVVFVAVNYHWVIELLLQLGERAEQAEKKTEKKTGSSKELNEDVGMFVGFVHESKTITEKLENMRNVSGFKRFISVATEPVILVLMGIWVVVLVLAIVYFDGCEPSSFSSWCNRGGMQAIFVVVAVVSNVHAVAVAVLIGVGVVVAICALLFYPCAVYLFLRRKPQGDSEDSEFSPIRPQTARVTAQEE